MHGDGFDLWESFARGRVHGEPTDDDLLSAHARLQSSTVGELSRSRGGTAHVEGRAEPRKK